MRGKKINFSKLAGKGPMNPSKVSSSKKVYRKRTVGNAAAKLMTCNVAVPGAGHKNGIRGICGKTYIQGKGRKGCHVHDRSFQSMLDHDLQMKIVKDADGTDQARNNRVTTFSDTDVGGRGVKSLVFYKKDDFITTHGLLPYTKG